jgi:NADH dehydrogenase
MGSHQLRTSQLVPADIDRVWAFFSRPENVTRVTPRSVTIDIRTPEPVTEDGALFEYRMTPLLGIPMTWRSRIEGVEVRRGFRDVQVTGPYGSWVHEHRFAEVEGGTRVDDTVDYRMPLGPLGELGHRLLVRRQLEHIFSYRALAVASIFEPAPAATLEGPVVGVAGGAGFVGSEIACELRRRGYRVVVLGSRGEAGRGRLPDDIEIRLADVRSPEGLVEALAGIDRLVISLAFRGLPIERPRDGATFMEVDAAGTSNLVAAARKAGVGRLLYLSGAGAGHDAPRHWFRAKALAEDAVIASGVDWTILRPTWIYGPDDVSLNRFLGLARYLPFVPLLNLGRQQLAPVFVGDVARLAADCLEQEAAREQVFEIGGPEDMTMREVIGRALRVAGLRRPILPGPTPLIRIAAWPMRFLPHPPLSPDAVDFVNQPATVDIRPLMAAMPRVLTRLEQGLATYLGPASASVIIEDDGRATMRAAA